MKHPTLRPAHVSEWGLTRLSFSFYVQDGMPASYSGRFHFISRSALFPSFCYFYTGLD